MVSGTFVLTDTIAEGVRRDLHSSTTRPMPSSPARRSSRAPRAAAATVPESLLAKVRALPEVAAAGGTLAPIESNEAKILGRDGKAARLRRRAEVRASATTRPQPQFSPLKLKTGHLAAGPEAGRHRRRDRRRRELQGRRLRSRCRRSDRSAATRSPASPRSATSTRSAAPRWRSATSPTAQTLLHKEGRFDGISIAAKEGTRPPQLVAPSSRSLPPAWQVKDAVRRRRPADAKETNEHPRTSSATSCSASAASPCSSARSSSSTRCRSPSPSARGSSRRCGPSARSRKQVMRSVVLEGLVIGLLASVIGLFARARAREGAERAVRRSARPPGGRHWCSRPGRSSSRSLARHRDHADREHRARAARDPRAADRSGARGLDRCRPRASPRTRSRRPSA